MPEDRKQLNRDRQDEVDFFESEITRYMWDRIVLLSPNAIEFITRVLSAHHEEPDEVALKKEIFEQLKNNIPA